MLTLPEGAIGAIVAAFIAGIVSLLGLIVSKEQKTSEFRQAWIDALRSEISMLISHANAIHGASVAGSASLRDAWTDMRTDFVGINEAAAKIRLRLNASEESSRAILQTVEEIERALAPGNAIHHEELNKIEKRLVDKTTIVLKREWERVKRGEMSYKIAKALAGTVVFLSIVAVFAYLFHDFA